MKKILLLTMLVAMSAWAMAQQLKAVSGKVTDSRGEPVPYASVKIKGSATGVSADANGNYTINAKPGDVLVIGAIGSSDTEITITQGSNVYNISLQASDAELKNVVVSALGIKRSAKSTPYAVQQISGDRLTQTRETDLTTALAGKVAGLQVLGQSGAKLGSPGVVRLRGVSGFADKGAIYVVDGTIVENVTDINMDDVASASVLKGPNAR